MEQAYKRMGVEHLIVKALQTLGGSASRKAIKDEIISDESNPITYENVYKSVLSRSGTYYRPFNYDFNFGAINLRTCGYIEDYKRNGDLTLTEKGRTADPATIFTKEDMQKADAYWKEKDSIRMKKREQEKTGKKRRSGSHAPRNETLIEEESECSEWGTKALEQIKQFSPKKFESFSRLLLSKMGVKFDREKGVKMSGDHGIDGYGFFESYEFRTTKVVIQCKRYTENAVSEPEIDRFKGVMMSFNADYGIFITTSYYTPAAQQKAVKGGNTVTLIDGQRIIDLIEKYQLHISPVTTYVLDDYYYEKD